MIGKQLNFQKARELALSGDIAGATKNIVDQVGSEADFNKLNILQRKSLAKSIGVSVSEMSKLVKGSEKLTLSGALAGKSFDDLVGGDSLSALTKIVNAFKSIAATLLDTFGGPIADFLEKFTGPDGLMNIKLQLIQIANMVIDTFNAGRDFLNVFRKDKQLVKRMTLDDSGNITQSKNLTETMPAALQDQRTRMKAKSFFSNPKDSVLATTNPMPVNVMRAGPTGAMNSSGGQNMNITVKSGGISNRTIQQLVDVEFGDAPGMGLM